jgi:hypothetical protein
LFVINGVKEGYAVSDFFILELKGPGPCDSFPWEGREGFLHPANPSVKEVNPDFISDLKAPRPRKEAKKVLILDSNLLTLLPVLSTRNLRDDARCIQIVYCLVCRLRVLFQRDPEGTKCYLILKRACPPPVEAWAGLSVHTAQALATGLYPLQSLMRKLG